MLNTYYINIAIKYKDGVEPLAILPNGDCEAIMAPRSSTFAKYGIIQANSIGVIDGSYRGDNDWWHFPAIAMRDTFIPKNERICQFRLLPNQTPINFFTG